MSFKKGNTIISRNSPLFDLLQATAATLRLSNQKNEIRARLIHSSATEIPNWPVKELVRRFLHLLNNKAEKKRVSAPIEKMEQNTR